MAAVLVILEDLKLTRPVSWLEDQLDHLSVQSTLIASAAAAGMARRRQQHQVTLRERVRAHLVYFGRIEYDA